MPRPKSLKPSYCHAKDSGRAFVTLNGRRVYLGAHGSQASRDEYDRVIGEWIASGRGTAAAPAEPSGVTVSVVVAAFWAHAQTYYRDAAGQPTSELDNLRQALRPLRKLYGATPAPGFGPKALKAIQQHMIALGWCRSHINRQTNRLRHVFKWAVSNELIPARVHHGLATVNGLRAGRTEAIEAAPVKPVPDGTLAATLPHLSRHVRAMADLQLLTGMRPGEVCAMRTCDITRTGKVWTYAPPQHKTKHHGHTREIRLGPKAQKLIQPFLKPDLQAHLFSPADAEAERLAALHEARKTPLSCGNRPGSNRQRAPKRQPRERFTVATYRRAIARACQRALDMPAELRDPETKAGKAADTTDARKLRQRLRSEWNAANVWHPHQLRHNAATLLRRQYPHCHRPILIK
jgi:integrase